MKLIVSEIPEKGIERELELPVYLDGQTDRAMVRLFIRVYKIGRKVFVEGSINGSLSLQCSRCLKEFAHQLQLDFHDVFSPVEDIGEEGEYELMGDEMDVSFYRNDELDLEEIAREQVLLSVPMKPVCSTECMGLCPLCGTNLNLNTCDCRKLEIDERLTPLQKLKQKMEHREKE